MISVYGRHVVCEKNNGIMLHIDTEEVETIETMFREISNIDASAELK